MHMWELDYKESWALKNWCFWTVVLEKILESPLDSKEIQPVHPKGNQSWIFIGRTDAEAETPILWPPDAKNWLSGKDSHAGKDWRQEEKGLTENEIVDGIIDSIDMSLSKLRELVMHRKTWSAPIHGVRRSRTRLSNWTELNWRPWLMEKKGCRLEKQEENRGKQFPHFPGGTPSSLWPVTLVKLNKEAIRQRCLRCPAFLH